MAIGLPEGFQLDQPQQATQPQSLPTGFQLDTPKPQAPEMSRGEAAFIAATNPLNFGDEIKAGISALLAKNFGGAATKDIDIGDLYREARTTERNKLKQAQETYPIQSGAIGFASDIPFETAVLGKGALKIPGLGINAIPGLNLTGSLPKIAAGGALLGAAGGAGASEKETVGGVAQDALTSGAIGAVAAPALASAIPAATNMIGKGASAVKGFLGKKTGEQIAQEAISPETARKGLEQLKASPEGQPTTALDIDSPEFQALAKTAVSRHPQAKQIAADFAAGRKEEAAKRIDNILSKDVSPVETYFGDFAEKQKLQKVRGAENYSRAYAFNPEGKSLQELPLPKRQELLQQAKGGNKISDEGMDAIFNQYKEAQRTINQAKPKSLTQFIKENGGIYDSGGDLKSMGLDSRVGLLRKQPYFTKTTAEGKQQIRITPDDVAQKAWEQGYFPEMQERPTINKLLDSLNEERRGNLKFSENDSDLVQKIQQAKFAISEMEKYGIDIKKYKQAKNIKDELIPANTDPFGGYIFKDKELSNLINTRPDFTKAAAKEAADLAQIEQGIKINPTELLQPSTKNVDMIKKGLDSLIDKETDALGKTSPKGRALEIYKGQLLNRMDALNPDYKKARNIYAGDFAVQKAQELGRKFDKMQPEEIAIKMKSFGQSEKDAFRVGQRLKLQEMADKSKTPAEKLFGNENVRKQLKASFEGNESKFSEFSQRLKEEASYDKTIKNLGLNKQDVEGTNRGLINMIARVAAGSKTGMVFEGARAAETAMIKNYKGLNDKNAKELIKAFTDKKASIRILENIVNKADSAQKPIIQKAINNIYPSVLGATLGYKTEVMSDAGAEEPNMSEDQIRQQLLRQQKTYPVLMNGIDINKESKKIKQRYYRD